MPSSAVQKCARSEEHTSELQSHDNLVCRLLLEKKKCDLRSEEHTSELQSHDNLVCRLLVEKNVHGLTGHRFILKHPVTCVFDPGLGAVIGRAACLGEAGTEPAGQAFFLEFLDDRQIVRSPPVGPVE